MPGAPPSAASRPGAGGSSPISPRSPEPGEPLKLAGVELLWSARDWAGGIAGLPVDGPLPCRTVLVPRERVAHALRRELLRAGLGHALAGTRFVTPLAAAVEVLQSADVVGAPGEEGLRPARLLALFRQGLALSHFPPDLLRSRPGWDEG